MLIATDYKGNQLVKCSSCGKIYPAWEHGCPECGSTSIIIMRWFGGDSMKRTICPYCGEEMLDDDHSTRFRCQFCGEFFDGWKEELHEKLKEAIPTHIEESIEPKSEQEEAMDKLLYHIGRLAAKLEC